MSQDDLIAFIRARLDEDEADALRWPVRQRSWAACGNRTLRYHNGRDEHVSAVEVRGNLLDWWERIYIKRDLDGLAGHVARHDPARALAEVKAKRTIVAACEWQLEHQNQGIRVPALLTLHQLATVYCDHPDYRQEWAPPQPTQPHEER